MSLAARAALTALRGIFILGRRELLILAVCEVEARVSMAPNTAVTTLLEPERNADRNQNSLDHHVE